MLCNYGKKGEVPSYLAVIAELLGEMADRKIDYKEVYRELTLFPRNPAAPGKPVNSGETSKSSWISRAKIVQ